MLRAPEMDNAQWGMRKDDGVSRQAEDRSGDTGAVGAGAVAVGSARDGQKRPQSVTIVQIW